MMLLQPVIMSLWSLEGWTVLCTAVPTLRRKCGTTQDTGVEELGEIHDPNTSDAPTMVSLVLRSPAVPLSKTLPSTSGTYHGISAPADQTSQQKDSYNGETRTASLQPCIPFWGEADPDQNWVQCNTCLKWRKLADGVDPDFLPVLWFCHMNDDPKFRSCQVEEEPDDLCGERPSEKKYKQEEQEELQQKEQQAQNSEDSKPTPNTSATSLKHSGTQQRIGDAQTNLSNSSPLSCSGDDHSADSLLATSTTEAASPSSRMKRNLFTRENEEVKRAKMNDQQNSTSEAVASVASVDLCVPVVLVTITLKKKSMQVTDLHIQLGQNSK
ncbi:hypothetical protein SKAU_G00362060 [Synaphobranchus kaupii]|uniref:CW-type domain-containing protein n=1 Tax=Synaphobranchus kaupii TaxID=118154 RepID=A0A9Q1IG65_SYNKA|nr:hypothetical protein SKAU_G00362060 [Synaphobranchus kaupii]